MVEAVKVTDSPAQNGFVPAVWAIETEMAEFEFTAMVIPLEVAVVGKAHERFDVMTQVTTWPLVNALVVYTGLFVPMFDPFTFH